MKSAKKNRQQKAVHPSARREFTTNPEKLAQRGGVK
jgi:hypothetical protein